jgi:hypothetical protein
MAAKRERGGATLVCPNCAELTCVTRTKRLPKGPVERERRCVKCGRKFATKKIMKRVTYQDSQRIVVMPAGKTNPRRAGKGPFGRYAALVKSRTVGDFVKMHPKWPQTIARAVREQLVKIV